MNEQTFVLKGTICYSNSLTELSITENGYLVCEDGRCAGVFDELPEKFAGISCTDFGDEPQSVRNQFFSRSIKAIHQPSL